MRYKTVQKEVLFKQFPTYHRQLEGPQLPAYYSVTALNTVTTEPTETNYQADLLIIRRTHSQNQALARGGTKFEFHRTIFESKTDSQRRALLRGPRATGPGANPTSSHPNELEIYHRPAEARDAQDCADPRIRHRPPDGPQRPIGLQQRVPQRHPHNGVKRPTSPIGTLSVKPAGQGPVMARASGITPLLHRLIAIL